jgi:transposase
MDRERLQENFLRMDVRTVIKFNVLLGKSAVECYKSLKEGLGTHAPSYETVCRWVKFIKNGREQTDDAPRSGAPTMATDELHVNQVKFVLEGTRSTSCTAIATEVRISPASVYHILTNSLGNRKVCAKWIPHVLNDDQRAMHVLLANTHLQHWRNEGNVFLDRILTVDESWMHSFDPQLKQQNAEWGAPMSPRKKIALRSLGALSCSSAEMGLCLTIPCHLAPRPMAHITAYSCRIK